MMKMIVPAILVLIASAAGGFGAQFLKGGGDAEVVAEHDDEHAEEGKDGEHKDEAKGEDKKKGDKKAKDDKGGGDDYGLASGSTFFKFSREFIVPIMRGGEVKSLVILNINLEAAASSSGTLFTQEPKIRDRIMTTLIGISNDGRTLENLTAIENFETIRTMVLKDLQYMFPAENITNVLILDVGKQQLN